MGPALLSQTAAGMAWLLGCAGNATVLLAASWLGARFLRRGAAAARHQLWALGVAGALLMPLLCWALPSLPVPMDLPWWPGTSRAALSLAEPTRSAALPLLTTSAPPGTEPPPGVGHLVFGLAWAAGTLLVSLRFLRGHLAAHRLGRAATPAAAPTWLSAQQEAAAALGMATRTPLGRSVSVASPMTLGVLNPRVLLPAAAEAWTAQRLRAVLLHELGHVRRQDTRIQLAAQLVCALYWWNPLAWIAAAHLRIEREHACDDLVLTSGIRASSYATTLLEVARRPAPDDNTSVGAICMVDPSGMEARLRRILDAGTQRRPPGVSFGLVTGTAALALTGTLACAAAAPAGDMPAVGTAAPAVAPPGPPLLGTVSFGAPASERAVAGDEFRPPPFIAADTLDLSVVMNVVQQHLGDLQTCYEQRLRVRPGLSGEVSIHWAIAPSGEVVEQCLTADTVGDPEVAACVNAFVRGSHFPVSAETFSVSVPFVFRAAR